MNNKLFRFALFACFISGLVVFAIINTDHIAHEGISSISFSSKVCKKWEGRGVNLQLCNNLDLSNYTLDGEMNQAEVGDSIVKRAGQNTCVIYKKDGSVIKAKFIYLR